ncbi:ThiF family adenylyltransferase [Ferdinandcohnia sp. SAFN-114]|uniref:ThiF family adenylyltransferase n=1 Tax=Ferdinandcohnia sp. SAFN-114 TaxID=3387275 RepID=UPI003F7F8D49
MDYLEQTYGAILVETENPIRYPVTIKISILVEGYLINLLMSLPFNFPDSFPKVKLDDQSFQKLNPLPHLDIFKTLCVFDDVIASPNPDNPLGVLDATIEKSREILLKGILKQNLDDYTDEFETYWMEESKGVYISIVEPSDIPKEVFLVPFKYGNWLEKGIFSDQKSEAIKWIQNLGGSFNEEEIIHVLYMPIFEPIGFPFPKDNKDIIRLLKSNKSNLKNYFHFLSKHKRPTKILFSLHLKNEYTWGVWEHLKPFKRVVSNYKGRKIIQTGLNGFRSTIQNGWLELIKEFPMMEIQKYSVKDVRAARLKSRGGDGKIGNIGRKVAVIGCGAVGSHIAQSLMDIGIQDLLLIDPDILSFENINRHLCGANQVGQKKTEAVKNNLKRHYPTSHIHVYSDDILSLLQTYPCSLDSYDFIIVAISNMPTELRLDELQNKNIINKPILNIWVEPYLAGGHAIWNEPNSHTILKTLFKDGIYKYQVLKNGNLYSKKELGCNTSFVPYGVLELKKFIIEVMMFIQQQLDKDIISSKAFTWLGNLTEQKKNNRLLSPKWVGASDFSVRLNNLENYQESVDLSDI